MIVNTTVTMLFDLKLVYVIDSCYYRFKAHAAKACVAIGVVFKAVRDCATEAHHRDLNLSAFVLTVEFYNFAFKLFKKHFGSKLISKKRTLRF